MQLQNGPANSGKTLCVLENLKHREGVAGSAPRLGREDNRVEAR